MENLFDEFTISNPSDWKERIIKELKNIDFETLISKDNNGIPVAPFYGNNTQKYTPLFSHTDWSIFAKIEVLIDKEDIANSQALNSLNNGASGLSFTIKESVNFNKLLNNIFIENIDLQFIIYNDIETVLTQWDQYKKTYNLNDNNLSITIIDPTIQEQLQSGKLDKTKLFENFKQIISYCTSLSIDTTIFQNAGSCSKNQLAYSIALCNEFLDYAKQHSFIEKIKNITLVVACGTMFFEEISKLRALRYLIQNILSVYKITPTIKLHCITSNTYRTKLDIHNNLIRDSISGMAAILGGCNALHIPQFDLNNKQNNQHIGERLSINQQLIIKEESYFNKIADASNGANFIEYYTQELAQKAWLHFKDIEKELGLFAYFEKGIMQNEINQNAALLIESYKNMSKILIGVNKYKNPNENQKLSSEQIANKPTKSINTIILDNEI